MVALRPLTNTHMTNYTRMTGCLLNCPQLPDESLLTNSSMNAPILEQEECSRSLTSDQEAPPHRSTSPRMKKLLASSKASKHASLQVRRDFSPHGNYYYSLASFSAGEWMGSSGLWEDRGPADHDRTGPPVPEPLSVIWFYLKSPRALTPSSRWARNAPLLQLLDPLRDNLVKTNSIFLNTRTPLRIAAGIVFKVTTNVSEQQAFITTVDLFNGYFWNDNTTHCLPSSTLINFSLGVHHKPHLWKF